MKHLTAISLATLIAVGAVTGAAAKSSPGGSSGVWTEGDAGIYTNTKNADLRFDTNTGRKAIPGAGAGAQAANPTDADENSVVSRPSSTMVDPARSLD